MTLLEIRISYSIVLAPFHLIKSSCVIFFWNIFHILKVTFSKTSQSTTSHKVYTIQVEFEVLRATNLRYPKLPRWQSSKMWHCVVWIIATTIHQITIHYNPEDGNLNSIQLAPKWTTKKKRSNFVKNSFMKITYYTDML